MRRYRPTRAKRPKGAVAAIRRHMAARGSLEPDEVPAWRNKLAELYETIEQDDAIVEALKQGEEVEDVIREKGVTPPIEVGEALRILDKDRREVCVARVLEDLGPDPGRPGHRRWRLKGE